MFRYMLAFATFLFTYQRGAAQVGIGTTTPHASARFQVDATSGTNDNPKGFLPPRIALVGTNSIAPFSTITPATGLLVYNTASAGTAPNNVTPGFYYYDGSKWQRVINQQPDATIEFDKATPTTAGVVFSPNTPQSRDFVYVSTVDGSQWTWNGTAYITFTPPASTPWFLSGGTNDAGSNKASTVYRTGSVGIGSSNSINASAQLDVNATNKGLLPPRVALTSTLGTGNVISNPANGLVVYNTTAAGTGSTSVRPGYYFYNGSRWIKLAEESNVTITSVTSIGGTSTVPIFATLGNISVRLLQGVISLATVSGTFNVCGSSFYNSFSTVAGFRIDCNSPRALTTTFSDLPGAYGGGGDSAFWYLYDNAAGVSWRITVIIGAQYINNTLVIERLAQL